MDLTEEEKEKLKEMIDMYDETMMGFKFIRGLGRLLMWILTTSVAILAFIEGFHWFKGGKG